MELADTLDLGSSAFGHAGSTPVEGTYGVRYVYTLKGVDHASMGTCALDCAASSARRNRTIRQGSYVLTLYCYRVTRHLCDCMDSPIPDR